MLSSGSELIVCIRIVRELVKLQIPRESDLLSLRRSSRICITSRLPGDADTTGVCIYYIFEWQDLRD